MGVGLFASPHRSGAGVVKDVRAVCNRLDDRRRAGDEIAGARSEGSFWIAATSGVAAQTRLESEPGECDGQLAQIG